MTTALSNTGCFQNPGWDCREPGFLQLIDAGGKLEADHPDFFKYFSLEAGNIDDELVSREQVMIGILGCPDREGDIHGIVAHSHAGAEGGGVDSPALIHRRDHDEAGTGREQPVPVRGRQIDLLDGVHRFVPRIFMPHPSLKRI